jgi:hypothetical protein
VVLFQLLLLTKKRRSQSGGAPVSYTYALVGKVMRSTHYMRSTFIGSTLKLFSVLVRLVFIIRMFAGRIVNNELPFYAMCRRSRSNATVRGVAYGSITSTAATTISVAGPG